MATRGDELSGTTPQSAFLEVVVSSLLCPRYRHASLLGVVVAAADCDQTVFGHSYLTDFDQSDFGQKDVTDHGQP